MKKILSKNLEDTELFAQKLLKELKKGDVLVLSGDLGAGKTTFTKGLAKALKITENVTSPTFTILNEYHSGTMPLYHFDMYRLEDSSECDELGFTEYFAPHNLSGIKMGICVIEWAEKVRELLPKHYKKIVINKIDDTTREFEVFDI